MDLRGVVLVLRGDILGVALAAVVACAGQTQITDLDRGREAGDEADREGSTEDRLIGELADSALGRDGGDEAVAVLQAQPGDGDLAPGCELIAEAGPHIRGHPTLADIDVVKSVEHHAIFVLGARGAGRRLRALVGRPRHRLGLLCVGAEIAFHFQAHPVADAVADAAEHAEAAGPVHRGGGAERQRRRRAARQLVDRAGGVAENVEAQPRAHIQARHRLRLRRGHAETKHGEGGKQGRPRQGSTLGGHVALLVVHTSSLHDGNVIVSCLKQKLPVTEPQR